ncbi:MAG: hypothetical protein HWN66_09180 [Candidatus Helarchaeota archaeon]|nr:hypothetical protein [Candidatus Helarchaeota archaeon]
MTEAALNRFEKFLERVIGTSKLELEGGKLSKAFLKEAERSDFIINEFVNAFTPRWNFWKRKKGSHTISPFIENQGKYILKIWLTFVFPFNYRRVVVDAAKGSSLVDAQGKVGYAYTPKERFFIKSICEKYQVNLPEREVARILITNAIKSLDPSISKILETSYRLFIDDIDFFEKEESLAIKVNWVGRIG